MNDSQTLELQIKSLAEEANTKLTQLVNKINSVDNATTKATSSVSKLGKAFSLGGIFVATKRLSTSFLESMKLAVDYTEQLNLFNVVFKNIEKNGTTAFSNIGKEATKFQNRLNEAFGTNKTETLYMQGIYQSMAENVGISDKYSAIMSETMTKFTYDLASLYNKSEDKVAEALRAGVYAGQTKPLRAYGIDVTQQTMQPILNELGIDKQVKELSQAEKEILRYIAALRQGKVAMGDFANTINSPANQLKVFKQQLVEAKVALTSLFIGTFAKILPYANAILMVVKEVSKAIASMFGIKLQDYNTGIATQDYSDLGDAVGSVGDSADSAKSSVKELKRELLGFDQVNNINEQKDTGSSGGSGGTSAVGGGIDQRLLDAINGYDNGMDRVRQKATDIRDKIMEWLGFTKHINKETGETYFTLDNTNSTLYKVIQAFKKIVKYGKEAIIGVFEILKRDFDNGSFGNFIVAILNGVGNAFKYIAQHKGAQEVIAKCLELLIGYKIVKTIFSPITSLLGNFVSKFVNIKTHLLGTEKNMTLLGKTIKSLKVNGWSATLTKIGSKLGTILPILGKIAIGVGGVVTAIHGLSGTYNSMKKMTEEANYGGEAYKKYTISILETVGGATALGAVIGGPLGAAIGALTGTVIAGVGAWVGYKKGIQELAEAELFGNLNISVETWDSILRANGQTLTDWGAKHDEVKDKLSSLASTFDSNLEALDLINYKYGVLGQTMDEEVKEKTINAVNEMCESTSSMIDENTNYQLELWGDFFKNRGTLNTQSNKSFLQDIISYGNDQKNELANTQNSITRTYENAIATRGYLTDDEYNYIQEQLNKIKELTNQNMSQAETDMTYWKTKISDGSLNIDKKSYSNLKKAQDTYLKEQRETASRNYNEQMNSLELWHTNEQKKYSGNTKKLEELERKYNIRKQELIDERTKAESEAQNTVDETTKTALEGLAKKYQTATDDQKKIIKSVFKNFGYDEADINAMYNKFSTYGTKAGNTFSEHLKNNLKLDVSNIKMPTLVNDVNGTKNYSTWTWKEKGGAFYGGSWHNIPQYANGGAPSHGTMFVAGERGAEVVGHINGRTEVLNQSQIASAIYSAVLNAMSQVNNQPQEIRVYTEEGIIVEKASKGFNDYVRQTGTLPFDIPV